VIFSPSLVGYVSDVSVPPIDYSDTSETYPTGLFLTRSVMATVDAPSFERILTSRREELLWDVSEQSGWLYGHARRRVPRSAPGHITVFGNEKTTRAPREDNCRPYPRALRDLSPGGATECSHGWRRFAGTRGNEDETGIEPRRGDGTNVCPRPESVAPPGLNTYGRPGCTGSAAKRRSTHGYIPPPLRG
jgi:hypothetical protein